jgi:SMI1-KNR4 cell-wall
MEKWYELLKDASVKKTQYLTSSDDLQAFEIDNNISLPEEYKGFCQVFGTGIFGNEISIYCPPEIEWTHTVVARFARQLEFLEQTNQISIHRAEHIARLLKNALIFGSTGSSDFFLWSLATENSDNCKNIYMVNNDSFECEGGEIEIVSKSFYTFIKDIALKNEPFTGVMSKYSYPDQIFESKFVPFFNNKKITDGVVESLVVNHSTEIAKWLLGSDQRLISVDPLEIIVESKEVNALILKTENTILQIDIRTRPDPNIPTQFFNDYLRLSTIFPNKEIRQIIIYLKPTNSPLVHLTSYETSDTKHDFEVIRLWEQTTDFFLKNTVLMMLAILSNTSNKQETLRCVAKIIENIEESISGCVSYDVAILARLVLDNESINQILQLD